MRELIKIFLKALFPVLLEISPTAFLRDVIKDAAKEYVEDNADYLKEKFSAEEIGNELEDFWKILRNKD